MRETSLAQPQTIYTSYTCNKALCYSSMQHTSHSTRMRFWVQKTSCSGSSPSSLKTFKRLRQVISGPPNWEGFVQAREFVYELNFCLIKLFHCSYSYKPVVWMIILLIPYITYMWHNLSYGWIKEPKLTMKFQRQQWQISDFLQSKSYERGPIMQNSLLHNVQT